MSFEGEAVAQDQDHLLGIFAAEVWLKVLGNVNKATDFQRISSSSLYFQTLLEPRATQVLFPEVLQILTQQQPPLFSSPMKLLPLRQVCHAWESGVETALHDPEYPFLFVREQWEKRLLMRRQPTYVYSDDSSDEGRFWECFGIEEHYAKFHQHFGAASVTRKSTIFFCREIFFHIVLLQDHFPHCLEFLQTYGAHIWHLFLHLEFGDAEQHRQFYSSDGLQQILARMPNLKSLDVNDVRLNDGLEEPELQELLQTVELSVALSPVPELTQLRMISLQGFPLPFLRALVQRNPQVRILSDTSKADKENHVPIYLEQMHNLTALELKLNHRREFDAFRRASVNCQLNKLHLYIKWGRDDGYFAVIARPVFRVLEESRFSATLTELSLKFNCLVDYSKEDEPGAVLQLPQLKKLTVELRHDWIPLDFVLPMKLTLEQLVVGVAREYSYQGLRRLTFDRRVAKKMDRIIKLYQFWEKPQKSNAWTLFPKLKLLRTAENEKIYSCTREEWNAKQK